jgi:hypothetical protein
VFGPGRVTTDLFWARNAIFHGLRIVGLAPGHTVLVPAYICRSVPEAILGYGAAVEFYRVDRSCQLDLEDIERRIRPGVGAVLAVHYFGVPQAQMRMLRDLCDRRGLFLIEDCAHTLPRSDVDHGPGRHGHICVYSWRKFLPVYDGATLSTELSAAGRRISLAGAPSVLQLRSAKDVLDRWRATGGAQTAQPGAGTERAVQTTPMGGDGWEPRRAIKRRESLAAVDPNGDAFRPDTVDLPMTWASMAIRNISDLTAVGDVRRRHWQFMLDATRSWDSLQPLHGELEDSCCPWIFPVRFVSVQDAHVLLRKRRIPAATWGGVRPEILPAGAYPEADELYRELVFLPVHQGLSSNDLATIVTEVLAVIASG